MIRIRKGHFSDVSAINSIVEARKEDNYFDENGTKDVQTIM